MQQRDRHMKKILIWVGVGLAVILVEVGISYFVITQFGSRDNNRAVGRFEVEAKASDQTAEDNAAAQEKSKPEPAKQEKPKKEENKKKKSKKEDASQVTGAMTDEEFDIAGAYTLSDFVVNPAYSQGKHFFVSSMVFVFRDKALVQAMTDKEPILQDRIISQLGKRTFAWFDDIKNRETLKLELEVMAKEILNIDHGVKVYFSKYVLQ